MSARYFRMSGIALLLLSACVEPTVTLTYDFEPPSTAEYRWEITTTTHLDSPNQETDRKVRMVVNVAETVEKSPVEGHTILRLRLVPIEIDFDGSEGRPPPATTTALEVDRTGRVIKVLNASNLDVGIQLDQLAAEMRPMLSSRPVALGDSWEAPIKIDSDTTKLDVNGKSTLDGFSLRGRKRLARISIDRNGTATTQQNIGRARVHLKGKIDSHLSALLDIDGGRVTSVSSRSKALFDLSLEDGGRAGQLEVRVQSRLIAL
ncbi:MAG: hypothetical protein ABIS18_01915 [Actinomycetota bacterium]